MKKTLLLLILLVNINSAFAEFDFVSRNPKSGNLAVGSDEYNWLYILDPGTLKPLNTISIPDKVKGFSYSSDGSMLVVLGKDNLYYFETTSFKQTASLGKDAIGWGAEGRFYQEGNRAVFFSFFSDEIVVVDLNSANVISKIKTGFKQVALTGYNRHTDEIIVFSGEQKNDKEELVASKDFPKDLKFEERTKYGQDHDQKGSVVGFYNAKDGSKIKEVTIPYTISKSFGAKIFGVKSGFICAGWDNLLLVNDKREISWKDMPGTFNYGSALVENDSYLIIGTLGDFHYVNTSDWSDTEVKIDKDPEIGFSNYVHQFAYDEKNKNIVAVTSGYLLVTSNLTKKSIISEKFPELNCFVYSLTEDMDDCIKEKFEGGGFGKIKESTIMDDDEEIKISVYHESITLGKLNEEYAKYEEECEVDIEVKLIEK